MNTTSRADKTGRWLFGRQLISVTETLDIGTAIYADPKMLKNMAKNAVAISDFAIAEILARK